jgi:hypothetical protein
MAVGDAFPPPRKPGGAPADCVVGPPVAPPGPLLALLRHVLARLRHPFTSLCVPLRSLRLGIMGGCFQMVLRLLEMRLGHRGVLLEGGLGFPSGRFEMVFGLLKMRACGFAELGERQRREGRRADAARRQLARSGTCSRGRMSFWSPTQATWTRC